MQQNRHISSYHRQHLRCSVLKMISSFYMVRNWAKFVSQQEFPRSFEQPLSCLPQIWPPPPTARNQSSRAEMYTMQTWTVTDNASPFLLLPPSHWLRPLSLLPSQIVIVINLPLFRINPDLHRVVRRDSEGRWRWIGWSLSLSLSTSGTLVPYDIIVLTMISYIELWYHSEHIWLLYVIS
jgi:hypothetical protein